MKIVIDDKIPFIRGIFEPWTEVVYAPGNRIDAKTVRDADALIIRTRTRCDAALLAGSRVGIIATATIGYDHVDMAYCRERGIRVATAAGCNARGVAQWVFAALGALELSPASGVLGIIGVGNVGSVVRDVALGAGFGVLCCDPPRAEREGGDFVSYDELLERADILTVHVLLDRSTRNQIDAGFLERVKAGAVLLNSSRGEVVDEAALKKALRSGRLSGAVLDVWQHEPEIDCELLELTSVATPHIAGYSVQGKAMGTAMSVCSVARFLNLPVPAGWYPEGVAVQHPRSDLSWPEIIAGMRSHYDILADDRALRTAPAEFERLRGEYRFRTEFF